MGESSWGRFVIYMYESVTIKLKKLILTREILKKEKLEYACFISRKMINI